MLRGFAYLNPCDSRLINPIVFNYRTPYFSKVSSFQHLIFATYKSFVECGVDTPNRDNPATVQSNTLQSLQIPQNVYTSLPNLAVVAATFGGAFPSMPTNS